MTKKTESKRSKRHLSSADDDRDNCRIPVQLLVDYKSNGNYLFDFCQNVGTGGIFIVTEKPLTHGSEVDLTFTIPDSKETLQVKGKVIWVQEAVEGRKDLSVGMGVQFTGFPSDHRQLLEDFVKRYHPQTANQSRSA